MIDLLSLYSPSQAFALKSCNLHNLNKNLLTTLDTGGKMIRKHYMQGVHLKKKSPISIFFFSFEAATATIDFIVRMSTFSLPQERTSGFISVVQS